MTATPELSCKTCFTPLDAVPGPHCPGCNLTFYREHPGSYLHRFRMWCPKCHGLLSAVETACPGCAHVYSAKDPATYTTTAPPTGVGGVVGAIDLHLVALLGLTLLPASAFVAGFGGLPALKSRGPIVTAVAVALAVGLPALLPLTQLRERGRFAAGGRARYAFANRLLLVAAAAWLIVLGAR